MALSIKIAPVATAMFDVLAPMLAPIATIALPPQIAVPDVTSVEISRPVRRSFPSSRPIAIAPTIVPTASASPLIALSASTFKSRRNPSSTTHAWISHFETNLLSFDHTLTPHSASAMPSTSAKSARDHGPAAAMSAASNSILGASSAVRMGGVGVIVAVTMSSPRVTLQRRRR